MLEKIFGIHNIKISFANVLKILEVPLDIMGVQEEKSSVTINKDLVFDKKAQYIWAYGNFCRIRSRARDKGLYLFFRLKLLNGRLIQSYKL